MFLRGQNDDCRRVMTPANAQNSGSSMLTFTVTTSLVLLILGLIFSIVAVLNPSWQVVEIREFGAEHHHGLWLDCTKTQRPKSAENLPIHNDHSLHCTYKFDQLASDIIDENMDDEDASSAAAESVHHQFFFWQKACLAFIFISLIVGGLALIAGICSPCSPPCALIFSILTTTSFLTSILGSLFFFFVAHRVDNRFVQGLVGTYEQIVGNSFYAYITGTVFLLLSALMSSVAAYQSLKRSFNNDLNLAMRDLSPMLHNQRTRV